jgi:predicted Zn-dependent protease
MTNYNGYTMNPRGGGMRWIIAIVILVVGLLGYWRSKSTNPITGEAQHVSLSPAQEKALGLQTAPQMAAQMGGEIPLSDPRAQLVSQIGQKIVMNTEAGGPNSPYRDSFRYHLLADPKTVNAFALPGGQIFITAGLLSRLENEAQLAGVLGHETGHVVSRHSAEHMAQSQLGQAIATSVGVAGSNHGNNAAMLAQAANQMIQLKYSRKDELEADSFGLKYMTQCGYDPREMIRVMEILKAASGGRGAGPDWTSTHPDPDARIVQIRQYLKTTYPNGVPANLTKGRALGGRGLDVER